MDGEVMLLPQFHFPEICKQWEDFKNFNYNTVLKILVVNVRFINKKRKFSVINV